MGCNHADDEEFEDNDFVEWKKNWRERVNNNDYLSIMKETNPILIPRNYLVEEALTEAETEGKLAKFNELLVVLSKPYEQSDIDEKYSKTPQIQAEPYKTFCGT
mgnify:FL=1